MSASSSSEKMSPVERRATIGLAGVYGLRMFGLFIILPVFAFYAEKLPGGDNYTLIGIALGAYGLTQALLQIPFGWLSDRIGRKPVIYLGLILFAAGSLIAATVGALHIIEAAQIGQQAVLRAAHAQVTARTAQAVTDMRVLVAERCRQ